MRRRIQRRRDLIPSLGKNLPTGYHQRAKRPTHPGFHVLTRQRNRPPQILLVFHNDSPCPQASHHASPATHTHGD